MTKAKSTKQRAAPDVRVEEFKNVGLAPENMRFDEPADDEIPQLADSLAAAGNVTAIPVRVGKAGEQPFMALDGRRRRYGVQYLIDNGRADDTFPLKIEVLTDPVAIQQAIMLPNAHRRAPHIVDTIVAIGKMRSAKMTDKKIADALGCDDLDVRRYGALSKLHADVLQAMRDNKISLRDARRLARIDDTSRQAEYAAQAQAGQHWQYSLSREEEGRVDVTDDRFNFVDIEDYRAAGGRTEADLFGEFEEEILDPTILQDLWVAAIQPVIDRLKDLGITVFVASGRVTTAPDGFEAIPYVTRYYLPDEQKAALTAVDQQHRDLCDLFTEDFDYLSETAVDTIISRLNAKRAIHAAENPARSITGVCLWPSASVGIKANYFSEPYVAPEVDEDAEDDGDSYSYSTSSSRSHQMVEDITVPAMVVKTEGFTHALHETITDYGTRGLVRAVADDLNAGLTIVLASLFAAQILQGRNRLIGASTIKAEAYKRGSLEPVPSLDGDVYARLEQRRQDYLASGLRPIPWIDSLDHGDKMAMMAELAALSLNLREGGTNFVRKGARADAAEIAELVDYDISAYWTPDEAYLKGHSRPQLAELLVEMQCDDPRAGGLKKGELVTFVAEQAAERSFAPERLSWKFVAPPAEHETPDRTEMARQLGLGAGRPVEEEENQDESFSVALDDGLVDNGLADSGYDDEIDEDLVARLMEESGLAEHVVRQQIAQANQRPTTANDPATDDDADEREAA